MKRLTPYIFFSLLFCVQFLSCKKSGTTPHPLIGKWYTDSIQVRQNFGNGVMYVTAYRFPSKTEYWDYRDDNMLYRLMGNRYDTVAYAMQTDSKGQQYVQYNFYSADTIKLLTSTNLIFIDTQGSEAKLFFTKQ